MRFWILLALGCTIPPGQARAQVTFHKDILPILQHRCQSCHRPGEIGPMSLLTYQQARPWAAAIREAVTLRKMPPWFADPHYGKFTNDPSLTPGEIALVNEWVKDGAKPGPKSDAPPPREWNSAWSIGTPDLVLTAPQPFVIPARATIDYQYLILSPGISQDRWVESVEIRPSDRSVVHHAVLYIREPADAWLRDTTSFPRGVFFAAPGKNPDARRRAGQTTSDILAIYTPGSAPATWPTGMAKLIPAHAELVLQIHYTSKAATARDQMRIAVKFFQGTPTKRVLTLQMGNDRIAIPPGEKDYQLQVSGTLPQDALLISLFPHLHLRGSEFDYELAGRGGYSETLLKVRPYDFYWQMTYQLAQPKRLRQGTRLICTAHYDNSPNNPRNPDPSAEVAWGEQSWEEMMIGFFDLAVEPDVDKARFFVRNP